MVCGSTLSLGGPDQGCLNCLARFALSPEDDETDGTEDFTPTRVFGHFEIVSDAEGWPVKLGRGAMGITYRARDTVLHTEVALKIIGLNVAGHPAARTAFLREARAAAKLRHANVASVFHYGEQDGQCFYAMELVEGETLEARLRRDGPLPPALALEVGRQVACALMEAEALGIVHRDLKPSNIMLAHRRGDDANDPPHVKVIDFGLAQAVDLAEAGEGEKTFADGFIGTPSFASPEQFARDGARSVDGRSDIYSLGITLWYLLCGKLPFGGTTLTGVHEQQVRQPLRLEQLRAARVPAPVVKLLQKMIRPDREERYPSARALLDAMAGCLERISPGRRWHPRQLIIFGLIALGGSLFTLSVVRPDWFKTFLPRRPVQPAWSKSLAVLPFENLSPGELGDYYPNGIQRELTSNFERIASIKVISLVDSEGYPAKPRDYQTIGRELGVDHLLEGSVQRRNGKVGIRLRLVDVHAPESAWSVQDEQPPAKVCELQSRFVRAVAGHLGADLTLAEEQAIDKPATTNAEAYDLYLQSFVGPQFLKGPTEMRAHLRSVLAKLDRVVALDPGFMRAYFLIARRHDTFATCRPGSTAEELAVDHRTLAEVALQSARRLDPDAGEVHFAWAWHFYFASHDNEQALHEAVLAEGKLPSNADLHALLGLIARSQGRWDDAIRQFDKSANLSPRTQYHFDLLAHTYRATRRYAEADRAFTRLIALETPYDSVEDRLRRALGPFEESGDLEPLRAALAGVSPGDDPDAENRNTYGLIAALCAGDADGLSRIAQTASQSFLGVRGFYYPKAWYSALAARMRGDAAGAHIAFAAARVEVERKALSDPGDARVLCQLAMIDAGLGRKEEAIGEAKRACEMTPYSVSAVAAPEMLSCLAVVYAWVNEPDLAFTLLNDLVDRPAGTNLWYRPTYGDLKLSPVWDPLRGDPRFALLMQRLAPRPAR